MKKTWLLFAWAGFIAFSACKKEEKKTDNSSQEQKVKEKEQKSLL